MKPITARSSLCVLKSGHFVDRCFPQLNPPDPDIKRLHARARTSFSPGPLNVHGAREEREKEGSVRTGWDGREGRGPGAGLGLNAPLRFGVLMENCGRAVQQRWQRGRTRPEHERGEGGREGLLSSHTHTRPFL